MAPVFGSATFLNAASLFWTVTDQDVSATQWVRCIFESQMPSVTLKALLVYDQSLLRVCPPGRTLGHNIIGVTDIACGHDSKRLSLKMRSGFLGLLDTASLNNTKKAWGGLIKTDHGCSLTTQGWRSMAT